MGCASSNCADNQQKNTGLRLITSKLHFKPEQLEKLNDYFQELAKSDNTVTADTARVEAEVERLVQRLVAGVGNLDRRFAALFLVSLNERRRIKQLKFEYLIRVDALSTPSGNPDAPELALSIEEDTGLPGFARLRLRTCDAGPWAEFVGPDGRLRRDLVKARVAALLAKSLKTEAINGVDERFCVTPGQVVDAEVLDKILKQPDHCRIFYGPADSELNLPDVDNYRVAIVEDESGIILKIGLDGSKSQDIEVRLLVGASINSWPTCPDYPKRIPLHHCDALLHYTAAQSGMYVVAVGAQQGLRCEDRSSLWRIRFPAAETMMRQHYSDESIPALTESALLRLLEQLQGRRPLDFPVKRKSTLRLVSRHMVRAVHWWSLEQRAGPDPLKSWSSDTLTRHVLLALDELMRALRCQNLRCYFQPRCNLMLQCARGGTLQHEDAYAADARVLESYMVALHAFSEEWLQNSPGEPRQSSPTRTPSSSEILEAELVSRWRQVLASLPRGTMSGHYGYGPRQLQYLGLVVKEVLGAKECLLQGGFDTCSSFFNLSTDSQTSESMENLIYLLSLVLRQAKDHVNVLTSSARRRNRRNRRRGRRSRAERNRSCAKAYYDRSVDLLVDVVRRDRETAYLDLDDNVVMAKTLLKWLYFGMEEDKKVLSPLLRPYLGNLFNASHEMAWHVESWRKRQDIHVSESRSLALFCKLVSAREILPANGIVEALSRGWAWADFIARMIERSSPSGLRLVFLTPERILRYQLKFSEGKGNPGSFSTWSKARSVGNSASRARTTLITATDTLPGLEPTDKAIGGRGGHIELRESSPLTLAAAMARRRGRQRGPGGLIPALVSLNKFRVLQEVAQLLPREERTIMLELVQKASREAARRRRASCPDPGTPDVHRQLYTPRSESKLYEPPATQPRTQRIIMERQQQLRREIMEIHDTLTRGLRSRSQIPTWDSTSMASTWTGSISRGGRLRRNHTNVWDTVRGTSPLWDSVSCNSTFTRVRSEEMLKSEKTPKVRTSIKPTVINVDRREESSQDNRLPSWEVLEKALSKKFHTYEYVKTEENKDVNVDYVLVGNDTKKFDKKCS